MHADNIRVYIFIEVTCWQEAVERKHVVRSIKIILMMMMIPASMCRNVHM